MQHIIQVDNTLWALISRLQGKELLIAPATLLCAAHLRLASTNP